MEIGICTSPQVAAQLPARAFDFIEVSVQAFLAPEHGEDDFVPNLKAATESPRPIKSANCFLPAVLKCVGPEVDDERLLRYAENTFRLAEKAGIEIIVVGSGAARALPEGFSKSDATMQFAQLLKVLGPAAQHHGVTLVVEPLNSRECNFINSLAEGAEAVMLTDHPNVRLLADIYHMRMENEPASEIVRFGDLLRHVHVAEHAGRAWPGKGREDLREFYGALKEVNYTGRIAIECNWDDITRDVEPSTSFLREQLAAAGL